MPVESSDYPAAYLITFHTYGSWLHGEAKGSVDRQHNQFGHDLLASDPKRLATMRARSKKPAVSISSDQRQTIATAIRGVCKHREWELLALNVRTNHVHLVVTTAAKPEKALSDFKAWSTRRLRELDLIGSTDQMWSRHGSTRYLWNADSVERACRYVIDGQGIELD